MTELAERLEPEPPWQRLHPLTPLLGGGKVLLGVSAVVLQQGVQLRDEVSPLVVLLMVIGTVLAGVAGGYVAWRRTGYRVTRTELQVDSGVLTRRSRRVPLARLQAVDVVRPLFARFLGLAELRLEVVGGGSDAEAPLAYLREAEAEQLRARLLGAAGVGPAELAQEPPDRMLVTIPVRMQVVAALLSPATAVLAVLGLALLVVALVEPPAALPLAAGVLPAALPVLYARTRRVVTEYGFTVTEAEGGLRLSRGLLDTRTSSIPDGRVQTVRLLEPRLWRSRGWVRAEVDVAGYAGGGQEQLLTSALLPVAPRELAAAVVARVLGAHLPPATVRPPERARSRAPLGYRRLAHGLDGQHLVATHGWLTTTTWICPLAKVQSLRLTAGPWQRALRLATLHVDSGGRSLTGVQVRHLDQADAQALLEQLATSCRQARAVPRLSPAPD